MMLFTSATKPCRATSAAAVSNSSVTIRELSERGIVLHPLREGIDTSNAAGRMGPGVMGVSRPTVYRALG